MTIGRWWLISKGELTAQQAVPVVEDLGIPPDEGPLGPSHHLSAGPRDTY